VPYFNPTTGRSTHLAGGSRAPSSTWSCDEVSVELDWVRSSGGDTGALPILAGHFWSHFRLGNQLR
jgi:hypothetical protein